MKKGIVVFLIMVIVAGAAFAGFSGSADISFGFDLDKKAWGFANSSSAKYSFKFDFDSVDAMKGDSKTAIWAEVAAEASASVAVKDANGSGSIAPKYDIAITKANIHVNDITIGILDPGKAPNYVKSYYDVNDKKVDLIAEPTTVKGFSVAYQGYRAGFGADGSYAADPATFDLWGYAETKAFTFGENDEISLQAGGYANLDNTDKYLGGSAKVSYAADKLAADAAIDATLKKGEKDFNYEAAANASYDFVKLNVYMAPGAETLKLDAKLSCNYDFDLSDDVVLKTSASVESRDMLLKGREVIVSASESTTIQEVGISLSEEYKVVAKELTLNGTVIYSADKYDAKLALDQALDFDGAKVLGKIGLDASITTKVVIENASVQVGYKDANLLDKSMGSILASAKIVF